MVVNALKYIVLGGSLPSTWNTIVNDSPQMDSILDALFQQIWMGNTHLQIWRQVNNTLAENPELAEISSAFFGFTLSAHADAALLHLARLLDGHKDAVSLPYVLRVASSHSAGFPHQQKHVVLLAVKEDEARLGNLCETINALTTRRDKQIAHFDKQNIKDPVKLAADSELTLASIEGLYSEVHEIVCRYSAYWRDSSVHNEMIGWDDFKELARMALKGHEHEEAEWRAKHEKWEQMAADSRAKKE